MLWMQQKRLWIMHKLQSMHKLQRYEEVWWTRKKEQKCTTHRVCTGKDGMANQGENIGNTQEGERKGNAQEERKGNAQEERKGNAQEEERNDHAQERKRKGSAEVPTPPPLLLNFVPF